MDLLTAFESETSGNELSSHPPIPRPLWWLPSRHPSLNLAVFPYSSSSHTNLSKSYHVYLLLQSQVLFQIFPIFWSHLLCPGLSPPPGCLHEASRKANLSVPCLKTLQWSPLPLSWGSRSSACPDGARWSALPIPLTRWPHSCYLLLVLPARTRNTKPWRAPHTPMLLELHPLVHASLIHHLRLDSYTHPLRLCRRHLLQKVFPELTKRNQCAFSEFPIPLSVPSYCLPFLQRWRLGGPSGQGLVLIPLSTPSTEEQPRDVVGIFWNLNLIVGLIKLLVKIVQIQIL